MRSARFYPSLYLIGVGLLLVGAAACRRTAAPTVDPVLGTNHIGSLEIVEENVPPTDLTKVPAKDLARHIDAIYRLKPDRRFVYAISEVHRLLGGRQETAFVRHLEGGGWLVRLGKADVGKLPEFPTFADGLALVRSWAARAWGGSSRPRRSSLDPLMVTRLKLATHHGSYFELLQVIEELNTVGANTSFDPELTWLAGQALLTLDFETLDTTETLDPVLGQAMALLVLSEHASSKTLEPRTLSMLAYQLGYENEALDLAAQLPDGELWGSFLRRDTARLRRLAVASRDPFLTLLAMRALARQEDRDGVLSLASDMGLEEHPTFWSTQELVGLQDISLQPGVDESFANSVLKLVIETQLPSGHPAHSAPVSWALDLWNRVRGRGPSGPVEARLREFDEAAGRQAARLAGHLVDREAITCVLRAPLYASLLAEANYYFDEMGSTPAAEDWVARFDDTPSGTAAELRRWVQDRVAVRKGTPGAAARISHDVGSLRTLGVAPVERIVYSLRISSKFLGDPIVRRPARAMFDGLDTRPAHLLAASGAARDLLYDLKRYQRFILVALQRAIGALDPGELAFVLDNVKDANLLWTIAERSDLGTGSRATALLHLLDADSVRAETALAQLRNLAGHASVDASMGLTLNVVWALEKLGRRAEAEKALNDWLESHGPDAGLVYDAMVSYKAERLRDAGHPAEALEVIRPVVSSWKEDCLHEAALDLLALGRCDEALEVARADASRYAEGGSTHALVAKILWRMGRAKDAATGLKAALQQTPESVWTYDVGPAFNAEFADWNLAEAHQAVEELKAAGVENVKLRMLGEGIGEAGDHRLAFEVLSSIVGTDQAGRGALLCAFKELAEASGRDAAFAWLRERMPVLTDTVVIQGFQVGADELAWGYPGEPRTMTMSFASKMLRAAAWARAAHPDPRLRERILEQCGREPNASWDSAYPRYMVRDLDDAGVLHFVTTMDTICNVAWLIGMRRSSEGDFAEANDWFQVAMEPELPTLPPYIYSYQLMAKWIDTGKFLERVQTDRVLFF